MKKLLIFICMSLMVCAQPLAAPSFGFKATVKQYLKELENLNASQKEVMMKAYVAGTTSGYGMLVPAIAWKESFFGKYMINVHDGKYGSFGPYHVRLDTYAKYKNVINSFSISVLASQFVTDLEFSTRVAVEYLNMFSNHRHTTNTPTFDTAAKYNGGGLGYKKLQSMRYALDVLCRMKALEIYILKQSRNYELDREIVRSFNKVQVKLTQLQQQKKQ